MPDEHGFAKPVALFAALDPAALLEVKTVATVKRIDAGSTFFREGDPATSFFVLDVGSVKLTQLAGEGDQVVLLLIGPGDAFGGVAAFGGLAYPVTAEAVTDSTAYEWPGSVMAALMERHPKLAIAALRFVADRYHELQIHYRQLATENVERRVGRALLQLIKQTGRRVDAGVPHRLTADARRHCTDDGHDLVYGEPDHQPVRTRGHSRGRPQADGDSKPAGPPGRRRRTQLKRPPAFRPWLRLRKDASPANVPPSGRFEECFEDFCHTCNGQPRLGPSTSSHLAIAWSVVVGSSGYASRRQGESDRGLR